ncbi:MAG: 1-acyl-sn-glycerol-3-phosphate acyltransferase [Nitrospirae bacterium]|nr:MAG: 1-acyl-sn-glycerol-3-phosphate acyltransferase [Nitrospirota bacterium]
MLQLDFTSGEYRTPEDARSWLSRISPSAVFYPIFSGIVRRASSAAKRGRYGNKEWAETSREVMCALETAGVCFEIGGVEHFRTLDGPCVFIGNHMSTLETMVLPGIIQPIKDVTFVVKRSLVEYPVFRHIMRSRDPITVGRSNPREDLVAVMDGGSARLRAGRSIIIFPQTTRTPVFDPEQFNTIGVKLAKKAGVPVVPVALKTDAWGNGRFIKEFGRIDTAKKVSFAFGHPLVVQGRGAEEHAMVIRFIQEKLAVWQDRRQV